MPKIRSIEDIASKWKEVTPLRAGIYKKNVENPLRDWEKNVLEASDRRDAGMREAIADGRINRGIKKAGNAKWSKMTVTKGPNRWSEGVVIAEPEYKAGFAPYRDVIEHTEIGPRYAKGDPRNWERSKKLGLALHNKKVKS